MISTDAASIAPLFMKGAVALRVTEVDPRSGVDYKYDRSSQTSAWFTERGGQSGYWSRPGEWTKTDETW